MHKVEQQGYKSCASLIKLADRYGIQRLENACIKALSYTPSSSLKYQHHFEKWPGQSGSSKGCFQCRQ